MVWEQPAIEGMEAFNQSLGFIIPQLLPIIVALFGAVLLAYLSLRVLGVVSGT